ncbi:MAG: type II secretion system F family protein [Phycisphaerae bacterium]|nr:type II secretion system F family protein [Phycisphaerae bacterium]NUQ46773.1 type II secretion system F family protein [Phycisphaerae bacterium]
MPTFTYVARNMQGAVQRGVQTADSEQALLRWLDEQSLFPVEVAEGGEATRSLLGGRKRVRMTVVAEMYSQLSDLLRAGVPALRALEVLTRQSSHPALSEILREVREDISGGKSLADAMEKHPNAFPPLHTSMIRAGERGGFLEDVLSRIAGFTERQNELRSKLLGSMAYPCILMFVGGTIVVALLVWVVPKIRAFLRGDLPYMTQLLFSISDSLRENGLVYFGGLAAAVVGLVYGARSEAGRAYFDRWSLYAPIMGKIVKLVAICRFCRILGTLLANGVPILQSLKISRDSAGNILLAGQIDEATEAVRKGESLAAPLAAGGLFPLDIVDMIAVGEESNNLENVLIRIADSYEARLNRQIDVAVRLLEPVMLIVMAGVVAFIAVALLLPILTMSTAT